MPRIDALWPDDEIDRRGTEIERREALLESHLAVAPHIGVTWESVAVDSWYVNSRGQYLPPDWVATYAAIVRRGDTPEVLHTHRQGPRSPLDANPDHPCYVCSVGDACYECRPDVWTRCQCGETFRTGRTCTCVFVCPCAEPGSAPQYHPDAVPVGNATEGGWSERVSHAFAPGGSQRGGHYRCSADCATEAGLVQCGCGTYTGPGNFDSLRRCGACQPCRCGDCPECEQRRSIRSYSYKPTPVFFGSGPVYLGLENEIDGIYAGWGRPDRYEVGRWVIEQTGEVAYLKSDGSLSCGFELVTHPMSLEWAMREFPWHMYDDMQEQFGIEAQSSTGIHVHVSRDGFSGARHTYMWLKFFHRNANPIRRVSRRDDGQWSSFDPTVRDNAVGYAKHVPGDVVATSAWYLKGQTRAMAREHRRYGSVDMRMPSPGRYSAINVQNRATLEVRTFAGSVDATEIRAALQLVNGTVEYTRELDAQSVLKKSGWNWDAFTAWLSTQGDTYVDLQSEIERLV